MGLRFSGFVSLESVTMTVIYLIETTHQKKYYGHVEYMIPKVGYPVHIQLRVSTIRRNESSAYNYVM